MLCDPTNVTDLIKDRSYANKKAGVNVMITIFGNFGQSSAQGDQMILLKTRPKRSPTHFCQT
jgi:hypothetical protein